MVWKKPGQSDQGSGGDGPPDLEAILKKWLAVLKSKWPAGVFENKKSRQNGRHHSNHGSHSDQAHGFGSPGQASGPDAGRPPEGPGGGGFKWFSALPRSAVFTLGFVLALIVYQGFLIVPEGQQGVVRRFGAYSRLVEPGLQFIYPWIESCRLVNTDKIDSIGIPSPQAHAPLLMLTNDENLVQVDVRVQYQMADPYAFLFGAVEPLTYFTQAAESAVRQVVGRSPLDDVLTEKRSAIQADIETELNRTLTLERYSIGIEVVSVNLQVAQAPEPVKEAFDDVIKAREDQERYVNEAQADAEKIKAEANGKYQRIIAEAEADKNEIVTQARGQVEKFKRLLPEYQAAPEITKERLFLETMEQVFKKSKKIILNSHTMGGQGPLLYWLLDNKQNNNKNNKERDN